MDKSPKKLAENEAFFLLNHEPFLNSDGTKRGSIGKFSPMAANYEACDMSMPSGENYAVGKYFSHLTNELYSWVYNSNGVHFIQRINGDGVCEIVYHGCLSLSASPKHEITQFRAYLKLNKFCSNRHGKTLVFVDGNNEDIAMIDVEASIATDFFTTPFFDNCGDPCDFIKMCVPDPCGCLEWETIPYTLADAGKSNHINDVGLKFSYRHIYYDDRASIWSEPSTTFFQNTKGCFDTADGLPRCLNLRIPLGGPMVDRIEIAYWKNGFWFKYDTVSKYKKYNNSQQYWYEREFELTVIDNCYFNYVFCNDKQCEPIANEEFNRTFNPMPRQPQGFFPVGLSNRTDDMTLAFYNYKQGVCPIDLKEVQKFSVAADCTAKACAEEYTIITIYAVVHNMHYMTNQPIFRLGGAAADAKDDSSDKAYFGGLNTITAGDLELGHGQYFNDKTRNFIAYIEGTDNWGVMEQWKADSWTSKEKWGDGPLANLDDGFEKRRWRRAIYDGDFFYQKLDLKVPRGTKGFIRLSSHHSTGNNQDASTQVIGILKDIRNYSGVYSINNTTADLSSEEIYVDTCGRDKIEITKAFVIEDNAIDLGLSVASSSYSGYLKDNNGVPVEGAVLKHDGGIVSVTDHNGFYHFKKYPGTDDSINVDILVEQSCDPVFSVIKTATITGEHGYETKLDITIEDEEYPDEFFQNVTQKIVDCNGVPVPGVKVALSASKYRVSGSDGVARFRLRNYYTRDRKIRTVLINGGCFNTNCNNDCNSCMPASETTNTQYCYGTKPTLAMPNFVVNANSVTANKGLKAGGRYPFGFVVKWRCGKQSAVNHIGYIDIPRTQEKKVQSFCSFHYDATGITLPGDSSCVELVRGENINPFELQWVVDEIERTADGKLKLTIQGLNDYNESYFFKTNTIYQWLKNDRVEFIKNGDGIFFDTATHGLLNYLTLSPSHDSLISGKEDAPADFFNQILITDDGKLGNLKKGAIIEIQRAKDCTTDPVYYGIGVAIPVVNGRLLYETGTFNTFDTYFVRRKIGENPVQTFEHFQPSDFWGDNIVKLSDAGRPYFVNRYENEQRFGRNLSLNAPLEFNYFGDYVKSFKNVLHGDITAMHIIDNKVGIAISEYDHATFEVGEDILRVGQDGVVRSATADQLISNIQAKLSGAYGCQYDSIGSVFFGDGVASWVDSKKNAHVVTSYQEAKDMSLAKCQRWFRKRCQEMETFNSGNGNPLNQYRWAVGQNQQSGMMYLTIKALRDSGINNEDGPFLKKNETIMFHFGTENYHGFASFTPEAYGRLDLFDGSGCTMVAFLNGLPYIFPIMPTKWNEFFGIACDWKVGVALNKGEEKRKRPLSTEVQSDTLFFVKKVTTENSNFISEIPPIRFEQNGDKWSAAFLSNTNSRGGLYGDEKPTGYFAEVLFVRDNTIDLKYNTIDNAKRTAYSELDNIFFKFSLMEQSGFETNL